MKTWLSILLLALSAPTLAQPSIDVQHYHFSIELNDRSDAITGKAWITVRFLEDMPAFQLDLVSVKDEKGMYAFLVREGQQVIPSRHVANKVMINLLRPAKKGEQRQFEIQYLGTPDDGLIISKNKYGDRSFFSDNWPDRARHWLPCNDTPWDKASVEFTVTAPAQYTVVSNGTRMKETIQGKNKTTHWRETIPLPTKVMVIGAAQFAVKEYPVGNDSISVSAWVFPKDSTQGFYDYALAPQILLFFSDYIGPYPFRKLANVQSKTIFGGMENASAIFYAENSVTGDRKSEALIAHEIVHQWFGNMATEKSFAHLWLSEGFATYLTNIYLEQKYGKDTLVKRMHADRREVSAFALTSENAVVDSVSPPMDLLNTNSYQKGSWVLHMLRHEVGDTAFKNIIREYYLQFKGGNADSRDFENIAEKVSGKNLDSFFSTWLHRPGLPIINMEWQWQQGQVVINLSQQQKHVYQGLLEMGVQDEQGAITMHQVMLRSAKQEIRLPAVTKPAALIADPGTHLLFSGKVIELK